MAARVPGFLGRVLDADGSPVGTCFQVRSGILVTAWHVLVQVSATTAGGRIWVDGLPTDGPTPALGRVSLTDPLHDLAVMHLSDPLPDSNERLSPTDDVNMNSPVLVTGHVVIEDPGVPPLRYLDAPGVWAGQTLRENGVILGRMQADAVMPGMSGAPVLRQSDGTIVGVVSSRYNSADHWLQHSAWIARTEDLLPLLHELPETSQLTFAPPPVVTEARERGVISSLITYLEDRRLITDDTGYQSHFPDHLRESAGDIRRRTNEALQSIDRSSPLAPILRQLQRSARNFEEVIEGAHNGVHGMRPDLPMELQPYLKAVTRYKCEIGLSAREAANMAGLDLQPEFAEAVSRMSYELMMLE
jgi:hypothetical protein